MPQIPHLSGKGPFLESNRNLLSSASSNVEFPGGEGMVHVWVVADFQG